MTVRHFVVDEEEPLSLDMKSVGLTDEQFYQPCADNPLLRLELTAKGELLIVSPTGGKTGRRNTKLTQRLANWTETDGLITNSPSSDSRPGSGRASRAPCPCG